MDTVLKSNALNLKTKSPGHLEGKMTGQQIHLSSKTIWTIGMSEKMRMSEKCHNSDGSLIYRCTDGGQNVLLVRKGVG